MKVLVSSICFINHNKLANGSEIYATFANRLVKSTMELTPFDMRIATNRPDLFEESLNTWPDRFSIMVDPLEKYEVQVGPFNQLLKFFALKDVPEEYDYVLYLDCDAGFFKPIDINLFENTVHQMEENGFTGMVNRSWETYLMDVLNEHESGTTNMFSAKFNFYNVTTENISPEWKTATLPCEHILFFKNIPEKLQMVSEKIEEFNSQLQLQVHEPFIRCASDMEAFELGIASKLAGYKFSELDNYIHHEVMCVKFNGSNWERVKL